MIFTVYNSIQNIIINKNIKWYKRMTTYSLFLNRQFALLTKILPFFSSENKLIFQTISFLLKKIPLLIKFGNNYLFWILFRLPISSSREKAMFYFSPCHESSPQHQPLCKSLLGIFFYQITTCYCWKICLKNNMALIILDQKIRIQSFNKTPLWTIFSLICFS